MTAEPRVLTCRSCEHLFDRRDPRAAVYEKNPSLNACPACNALNSGREAWAVWNSCNGVFSCSVAETKESADRRLETAGYFDPSSESVVPVVIVFGKPFVPEPTPGHR